MNKKIYQKALQLWWRKNRKMIFINLGFIVLLVAFFVGSAATLEPIAINHEKVEKATIVLNALKVSSMFLLVPFAFIYLLSLIFLVIRIFTNNTIPVVLGIALILAGGLFSIYALYDRYDFAQHQEGLINTNAMPTLFKESKCGNYLAEFAYFDNKVVVRCNGTFYPTYNEVILDKKVFKTEFDLIKQNAKKEER